MIRQYSLARILAIWAAAALPMALLGWVVAPALGANSQQPGLVRLAVMTAGLVWQFVLVLIVLGREGIDRSWSSIRRSLWLTGPRSPESGVPRRALWWWLLPLLVLTAAYQMLAGPWVHDLWISVFPGFAEPPGFSLAGYLESPDGRAQMVGLGRQRAAVRPLPPQSAVDDPRIGDRRGLLLRLAHEALSLRLVRNTRAFWTERVLPDSDPRAGPRTGLTVSPAAHASFSFHFPRRNRIIPNTADSE